uniref:Spectrin repeat containing, nuclear envelope 2a n=1 Tax=Lepisosteus oculatus TaxID=7918 RepID=W5MW17_LEPOC
LHFHQRMEQEQIQKRTFTNWINAQLSKRKPPSVVLDLFADLRDGVRLLDLLEVITGQPLKREKGRGVFQHRSNIETALKVLRRRSIKLVNINIPDIIDGKPSIILGLIWTIILHFHIEELASVLAFSSRHSSMESLASVDSCSTTDSTSPRRTAPLHAHFKLSARKALLLWAREQCAKAGCGITVQDFRSSWRSGLAFLAILYSLRPAVVDLQKSRTRTNMENLEEAFRIAEQDLHIPRLLEPEDVDVKDPDEKSIMTYVAQFLQYSKDLPMSEEDGQKISEVISWLQEAQQELVTSWAKAENDSYPERHNVFQTFLQSFREQRRLVMPLLSGLRRTAHLSEEQRRLKEVWDSLNEKLSACKVALDQSLPAPLDDVGAWLLRVEAVLGEEDPDTQDHVRAAESARARLHLLKALMEEMSIHLHTLQAFPQKDEHGATRVPPEKMEELKRRFTNIRVTAKYHGIKLEYQESSHTVQGLLEQIRSRLCSWKSPYSSREDVRLQLLSWHDSIDSQGLVSRLEAAILRLRSSYAAADSQHISKFMKEVEEESAVTVESVSGTKAMLERVLSAWDSYTELHGSLQAWLDNREALPDGTEVTSDRLSEWSARHAHLNEVGNLLIEATDEQTSGSLADELRGLNRQWAAFMKKTKFVSLGNCSPFKKDALNIAQEKARLTKTGLFINTDIRAKSQGCVELQQGAAMLEGGLAELQQWESLARDTHRALMGKGHSPTQDPAVKLLISRGQEHERQVVTEEQFLLATVETLQKNKSLRHLTVSGMQARVSRATAKSQAVSCALLLQEVQAMLSSLADRHQGYPKEADVRVKFEKAKHRLLEHILAAITVLGDKQITKEQVAKKEEFLKKSNSTFLEEFLESAEQMKSRCSSSQQREIETLSQSLRKQWEDVHLDIAAFLQQLKFEIEKGNFNKAALQCELQIKKEKAFSDSMGWAELVKDNQVCFSTEGSLDQARQHLEALRVICDTLSSDKAHSLTRAQLGECVQRLEAIEQERRDFCEPQQAWLSQQPPPGERSVLFPGGKVSTEVLLYCSRHPSEYGEDKVEQTESFLPSESSPRLPPTEIRYRESMSEFENQLCRNRQSLQAEFPPDAVSSAVLHAKLLELQALREETESLWFEFELQCSQMKGRVAGGEEQRVEEVRSALTRQWRGQQLHLKSSRLKSIETAVGLIEPVENQISHFSNLLDEFHKIPKEVRGFELIDGNAVLKDLEDLGESIQHETDRICALGRADSPALSGLNPAEQMILSRIVLDCGKRLEALKQSVWTSEAALRALEHFLTSLRRADHGLAGLQATLPEDVAAVNKDRAKLEVARQSLKSTGDQCPELDSRLNTAQLSIWDCEVSAVITCQGMLSALAQKTEDLDRGLLKQQQSLQREKELPVLLQKGEALRCSLQELHERVRTLALKEPTRPALQQRLRALRDLESQLNSHRADLEQLRDVAAQISAQPGELGHGFPQDLEVLWEETEQALTEGQEQCSVLMDLLKKFQGCRGDLCKVLQRAEQTILKQASYMGKDNLQGLLTKVSTIKEDLSGWTEGVEELRAVCRHLQSQLKKIPGDAEVPFEAEADSLVDRWLDVMEKTDSHIDNLHHGLMLWEKLLSLAANIEQWAIGKLATFAEWRHFLDEQEVATFQSEIEAQQENIEHFHNKAAEIQELLQSKEFPLELQVIESQLRKRMEEVEELSTESSEAFQELMAVKKLMADRLKQCYSCLETIESTVIGLAVSDNPQASNTLQEEEADSILREVGLMASVASPHLLGTLAADGMQLKERIQRVQELFCQKRNHVENSFLQLISEECQAYEQWLQELQLSMNECFENPERRQDMESSLQRLTEFLACREGERRIARLKESLSSVGAQLPEAQSSSLSAWLQEQEEELNTFRSHCQNKHSQLDAGLRTLDSLQEEYMHLDRWLQGKEQKTVEGEELDSLYEEIQKRRERFDALHGLVLSARKQGLKSDETVQESERLVGRYCSLQARLCAECEALLTLSREVQAFITLRDSILSWVTRLQDDLDSLRKDTQGSRREIQERLHRAEAILRSGSEGEAQVQLLKQSGQNLAERARLDEARRGQSLAAVREAEERWGAVVRPAAQHLRVLQGVAERWDSCLEVKQQVQSTAEELRRQTAEIALRFPWPGAAERCRALEGCRSLAEKARALSGACDRLQTDREELSQLTRDPSFAEESWTDLVKCTSGLLKDLEDVSVSLEGSLQEERRCGRLMAQARAAQHSLGARLGTARAAPRDRASLHDTVSSLQVLLESVAHNVDLIKELENVSRALQRSMTLGGQSAIAQEIILLQEQNRDSETEILQTMQELHTQLLNSQMKSKGPFFSELLINRPAEPMGSTELLPTDILERGAEGQSSLWRQSPLRDRTPAIKSMQSQMKLEWNMANKRDKTILEMLKNQPAKLHIAAMTQCMEETQVRDTVLSAHELLQQLGRQQTVALTRLDKALTGNPDTAHSGVAHLIRTQWGAILQDISAITQDRVSQLQLVTQYHRTAETSRAELDKLRAEMQALQSCSKESSSHRTERLKALLLDIEQEKAVMKELLEVQAKISPLLNEIDKNRMQMQLGDMRVECDRVDCAAQKILYRVSLEAEESKRLLLETQGLQTVLGNLHRSLNFLRSSPSQREGEKAKRLMMLSADVIAAQQKFSLLQQHAEALTQSMLGQREMEEITQAIQILQAKLGLVQDQISAQTISTATMFGKIMKIVQDAFTWAKRTEGGFMMSNKIALNPEDVKARIDDMKKVQSEIAAKQFKLQSFTSEVRRMIPQLDEKDVPKVLSLLKTLEQLYESTAEKSLQALQNLESGLQMRARMFEQIADINAWIIAHSEKECIKEADSKSCTSELELQLRRREDVLLESDKHAALVGALCMKSRDISSELSVLENCYLNDRLMSLQEDIKGITGYEKTKCQELIELLNEHKISLEKMTSIEQDVKEALLDLDKCSFPLSKETICTTGTFKYKIVDLKFQVEQLCHCEKQKQRELFNLITELENKITMLEEKAQCYEKYLSYWQHIKNLSGTIEKHILETNKEDINKADRHKRCQDLLEQFPGLKRLCSEAADVLSKVSSDLDPSQLRSEQQKLLQATVDFNAWAQVVMKQSENLERKIIEGLDFQAEYERTFDFLKDANVELHRATCLGLDDQAIVNEIQRCLVLQRDVETRMRILWAVKCRDCAEPGKKPVAMVKELDDLQNLAKQIQNDCALRMEGLSQAREVVRVYFEAIQGTANFLSEEEAKLQHVPGHVEGCEYSLQQIQEALSNITAEFESRIAHIQLLFPKMDCLSLPECLKLHAQLLSELLVRVSTVKSKAQLRLEALHRCVEKYEIYKHCYEEVSNCLDSSGRKLAACFSKKVASYKEYLDQQENLMLLVPGIDGAGEKLAQLQEAAVELQGAGGDSREVALAVSSRWQDWLRMQRCARELGQRTGQRAEDWRAVSESVERATVILDNLQDELPEFSPEKATAEELQELLESTEQYKGHLVREQAALSALVLKVRTLLGVSPSGDGAQSTPLFQQLLAMQDRYTNLRRKAGSAGRAGSAEMREREQVKEEIQGVKEWLVTAVSLLAVLEHSPSKEELQEVQIELGSQKAVLEGIMDKLRMKYSDMYTLVPMDIEAQLQEVSRGLQEVEEKVEDAVEKSSPFYAMGAKICDITAGLANVQTVLQQRSKSVMEAKGIQKHVWDELEQWHSRVATLEADVQELSVDYPDQAHQMMDNLMEPLQLYQNVAKQAEQRTALLRKTTSSLQEFDEMISNTNSWLSEALPWLSAPYSYSSAKCLSRHVNALQMVLADSEQRRKSLQDFRPLLQEISTVCDTAAMEEQLSRTDQRIASLQQGIQERLPQLQHACTELEAIEMEVKLIEKNITKIRTILSTNDTTEISPEEHLRNRQVILDNIQPMKRTIAEIRGCRPGVSLPEGASAALEVFDRAEELLLPIEELEQVTIQQSAVLKENLNWTAQLNQYLSSKQNKANFFLLQNPAHCCLFTLPMFYHQVHKAEEEPLISPEYQEDILMSLQDSLTALAEAPLEAWSESKERANWPEESKTSQPQVQTTLLKSNQFDFLLQTRSPAEEGEVGSEDERGSTKSSSSETLTGSVAESGEGLQGLRAQSQETLMTDPHPHELADLLGQGVAAGHPEEGGTEQLEAQSPETQRTATQPHSPGVRVIIVSHSWTQGPTEARTGERAEAGGSPPCLRMCQEFVTHLEVWLQRAGDSFRAGQPAGDMQGSVEQQLLGCQEKLLEIEQKVALLALGQQGSMASAQADVEALSCRLEQLKTSLVTFQQLLQEQNLPSRLAGQVQNRSRKHVHSTQNPGSINQIELILSNTNRRNIAFQTPLLSPQELEQELSEQRDLTKAIALHHGRTRLHSHSERDPSQSQVGKPALGCQGKGQSPDEPPAGVEMAVETSGAKWQPLESKLAARLTTLEELVRQDLPSQVSLEFSQVENQVEKQYSSHEEIQALTTRLRELGHSVQSIPAQPHPSEESCSKLDEDLYDILTGINLSLGSMEDLLLSHCDLSREDTQLQIPQLESVAADLTSLDSEMSSQRAALSRIASLAGAEEPEVSTCLDRLQSCLPLLLLALSSRKRKLHSRLEQLDQYQTELRKMHASLLDKKSFLLQTINGASGQSIAEQLQMAVQLESMLEPQESCVSALKEQGQTLGIPTALMLEVTKLEDVLDSAWSSLHERREELTESLHLERHYGQLLQGLASLVDMGRHRATLDPRLALHSHTDLQGYLQKHKKFFQNLGKRMVMMEHLSQWVPVNLFKKHEKLWTDLVQEMNSLQQKGLEKGTELQRRLQVWSDFDESHKSLCKLLQDVEARIPTVGLVEESDERLSERLSVYQQIQGVLRENAACLSQAAVAGRGLRGALGSAGLEAAVGQLESKWLEVHVRVEQDHHRVETLRKLWSRFREDSLALSGWMGSAMGRLKTWKQDSVTVAQEKETLQQRLAHFLEFAKEVEAQSALKASVLSTGAQLLQLKQTDTAALQTQLAQFEQSWTEVLSSLPTVQEKLHQLLMEKVSSREAMAQLDLWMSGMKDQLQEDEERVPAVSGLASITQLLKKYKEYSLEMSYMQLTVDFVNQSVLQTSSPDVQGKRYERKEFAEQLGALNLQSQRLQGALSDRIRHLESLQEEYTEKENKLQLIHSWVTAQRERVSTFEKPDSRALAEKALKECQETEEKLRVKSGEAEGLRERCQSLDTGSKEGIRRDFMSQVDDISAACTGLSQQLAQMKTSLQTVVQRWGEFEGVFGEVELSTIKVRYSLEHCCCPLLSFETLRGKVGSLKNLQDGAEMGEEGWQTLTRAFSSLKDLCSSSAAQLLSDQLQSARTRWMVVNQDLTDELRKAQSLFQLWHRYRDFVADRALLLDKHQEECSKLLSSVSAEESTVDFVRSKVEAINGLQEKVRSLQSSVAQVLEISEELMVQMGPSAAAFVQSESRSLPRRLAQLEGMLAGRLRDLQSPFRAIHNKLQNFKQPLLYPRSMVLSAHTVILDLHCGESSQVDIFLAGMLKLSALSPDLQLLNELSYRVPLNDNAARRLQTLNRQWALASAQAVERCSVLQGQVLQQENFQQKCERWLSFLQAMEDNLAVDIAGCYPGLREQQRVHQRFQAEVAIGHQILHSVISEALLLLEKGEVEDRSDFILKLSQLKEQWQGAVHRAQQRKGLVDGLVRQWQLYRGSLKKLRRFLADTAAQLPPASSQSPSGLHQLRIALTEMKHLKLLFQRHHSSYVQALEGGRQLFSMGDAQTQALLQGELSGQQEAWEHTCALLDERSTLIATVLENWERCQIRLAESRDKLQEIGTRVSTPLPMLLEELPSAEKDAKAAEESLEDWFRSLTELTSMKTEVSQYIIADDVFLLQEQVEHLHCQWEELCVKVSLRKQEIADRLNAWIIFNEKNKELCEWLTQMENKVARNADLSIEEMVEKLKKDCMEEINLFSENKTHLKQLGEQLIKASNKTKETEVNDKLKDINDRWQHLFDHIEARVKKLKDTLATVQQLDKNMSNLRTWLSRIEAELAKPVIYTICGDEEIQRKLAEQQDLQRDIEQHSEGVTSVLNLCDVLLHDTDACTSETECDSIQQTTRSLDRRWRNICAMSMERRFKIEDTWRLWCRFLEDYSRFEDWLKTAERTAASPNSAEVLYTNAKEELKKFEAFQRQVHERLTQLELVNKQYRRLARENRTDAASRLKLMVHEGNQRWDNLQKRVSAILRRLKHFTSQREEFESTRDGILVWLTEMDLQLTNVEHFSESDIEDKMRQLNGFQQEIMLHTNKIDQLIVFGENLIQKSEPIDAVLIEDELEELHSYCQEVFGRVARFHHRLTSRGLMSEEERELSDRDTDLDESSELQGVCWEGGKEGPETSPSHQAMCHLMPPAPGQERSGRETPVSVDSIPLEWDHTVDVGGSSSHEDEEEATYYSALSGKAGSEPPSWHSPEPVDSRKQRFHREILQGFHSQTLDTSTPYKPGYVSLLLSVSSVTTGYSLATEPHSKEFMICLCGSSGVIERWELFQAQALSEEIRIKQNLQQWQQLNSDLCDITTWLDRVRPQLEQLQKLESSASIRDMENNIKKLKEMQKAFANYKAVMISINLSSKDFQQGDSIESQELQAGLKEMNQSWVQASSDLEHWEEGLQNALMKCQEFHETTHSLLLWLAHADSRRYALDIHDPAKHRKALLENKAQKVLEAELLERQQQVSSLQEISAHLLLGPGEEDCTEARERVHVIANKLKLLLRQVAADLQTAQGRLDGKLALTIQERLEATIQVPLQVSAIPDAVEQPVDAHHSKAINPHLLQTVKEEGSPPRSFFYRVLRAAFPLHLLFLLLLVLACLVPLSEEDYSCTLSNNFARSFYPMLRYTNGPPPT